jgi:hypothetical protein
VELEESDLVGKVSEINQGNQERTAFNIQKIE